MHDRLVGINGLALAVHVHGALEAHVAVGTGKTKSAGRDVHGAAGALRRDVNYCLIQQPQGVTVLVVGEADAGAGHATTGKADRTGRLHNVLGVGIGGLFRERRQSVIGLELDVALEVIARLVLADAGFLASDGVAAAGAVVDRDLDADQLGLAGVVGDLAFELDARVLPRAF